MIVIQKQSGANSVNIAKKVHQKLPEIQASLPSDVKLDVIMDTSTNILNTIDSLKEPISTLPPGVFRFSCAMMVEIPSMVWP